MTSPLKLPPLVKTLGRAIRDYPPSNHAITNLVRPLLNLLPNDTREKLMAHLPRVGTAMARLPSGQVLTMRADEPEALLNRLFYRGWMGDEPEVLPLWAALASKSETVIDVGAHVGHFSLVAGLLNPDARIIAFEPLPRVADLLRNNICLNGLRNVDARQRAVGRDKGSFPFYAVPSGIPSSSSLSKEFMLASGHDTLGVMVEVSMLDAEDLPTRGPTIMKIDTETTEADVIAGGVAFITSSIPVIIVEVLDRPGIADSIAAALRAADYSFNAFLLTDQGAIAKASLVADPHWRNYLLVPRDRSTIGALLPVLEEFNVI